MSDGSYVDIKVSPHKTSLRVMREGELSTERLRFRFGGKKPLPTAVIITVIML